jgi:hypothetical protein
VWHHGVTDVYGRRLLTCWKSPTDVFAVDKEALMCCLLGCRTISRLQNPAAGKDQLSLELSVYYKRFNFFKVPLQEVDKHVTQLMKVLLSSLEETEMCLKIKEMCAVEEVALGKRQHPADEKEIKPKQEEQVKR